MLQFCGIAGRRPVPSEEPPALHEEVDATPCHPRHRRALLGATATAALAARIRKCFTDYKFRAEMKKEFLGDDRFLPVSYQDDRVLVRKVAEASGTPFNKVAYEREIAAEAKAKK
jgi:hypothetical protein